MIKIFVSYRRADSRKDAGRLYDRLVETFGKENVFKDVDSIPYGRDFRGILAEAVAGCNVLLAVIGQQWLTVKDEHGNRRLDNPDDFVRIEIRTALQRDKCLVVPVQVDGAPMLTEADVPSDLRELVFKNAIPVRDDPDFHNDVSRLIASLLHELGDSAAPMTRKPAPAYNVSQAIARFYEAFEIRAWEAAREVLSEIRASGKAPRVFNLDSHEKEVWDAILLDERDQEYDVLRMMAKRGSPAQVWAGLQVFWETFPGHDPDELARLKPAPPKPPAPVVQPPSPKHDPVQEALARAREFVKTGKLNKDWTPFPVTFNTLKIPDMLFCLVPTGTFQMGADDITGDEKPIHAQTFTQPFYIAQYPVTNAQWALGVKAGVVKEPVGESSLKWYKDPAMANAPVVGVTWFECQRFVQWMGCRLPTEREWEYAARGVDGLKYPWGNEFITDKAVYDKNSGNKPWDVTSKPDGASWAGACHLSGNVWEWSASSYEAYPYLADGSRERDTGDRTVVRRVLRGGSWSFRTDYLRASDRNDYVPAYTNVNIGFRCARSS